MNPSNSKDSEQNKKLIDEIANYTSTDNPLLRTVLLEEGQLRESLETQGLIKTIGW